MKKYHDHKELNQYFGACQIIADTFIAELYPNEKIPDSYWVGDDIGGVFSWGDWYVNMNHIADYFKYNMTPDEFFEWYDDYIETKGGINIRSWKLKKN